MWVKQVSPDPKLVLYHGICDYCGDPNAQVYRAHVSAGGPLRYDSSNHDDIKRCLHYLKKRVESLEKNQKD